MITVWLKRGVEGDLKTKSHKGLGRVISLYEDEGKSDFYITSIREGNHGHPSLHYIGDGFDFRKQGVPISNVRGALGVDFDVVEHSTHYHAEYDP